MSLETALQQLKPLNEEELLDWMQVKRRLQGYQHILWYAGSCLDCTPMLELEGTGDRRIPWNLQEKYSNKTLFIFSDYRSNLLEDMKTLYDELDEIDPEKLGWRALEPKIIYRRWTGIPNGKSK